MDLEDFMRSRSKRLAMRFSIVLIVEVVTDLGIMILRYFNEEVKTYREVFLKLAERGVISFGVGYVFSGIIT